MIETTEKEKALEIYTKFQLYIWHEVDGLRPDDIRTLRHCVMIIDEILNNIIDKVPYEDVMWWHRVKQELKKI